MQMSKVLDEDHFPKVVMEKLEDLDSMPEEEGEVFVIETDYYYYLVYMYGSSVGHFRYVRSRKVWELATSWST